MRIQKKTTHAAEFAGVLKNSLTELLKNDPLRMAGATAFFTTFALPPILVILIQVLKIFVSSKTNIRRELFKSLSEIVGPEAVRQVAAVLQSMRKLAQNWYITIGGFIFLLFVATTLFKIIKNSVNQVWKIRPHQKLGFVKNMRNRVQAVLVILIAGLLFMIGILGESLQAFLGRFVFEISPFLSSYFNSFLNYLISICVVTLWFMLMFRFLPDGRPDWSIAFAGGFITAILFTIGKLILHWLLSYSNITTLYGTSASIVLLLLFVFYSSLILYYGAAFTKIWGIYKGRPIEPLHHAMHYRVIEEKLGTKDNSDEPILGS
jgi:membrane protein